MGSSRGNPSAEAKKGTKGRRETTHERVRAYLEALRSPRRNKPFPARSSIGIPTGRACSSRKSGIASVDKGKPTLQGLHGRRIQTKRPTERAQSGLEDVLMLPIIPPHVSRVYRSPTRGRMIRTILESLSGGRARISNLHTSETTDPRGASADYDGKPVCSASSFQGDSGGRGPSRKLDYPFGIGSIPNRVAGGSPNTGETNRNMPSTTDIGEG